MRERNSRGRRIGRALWWAALWEGKLSVRRWFRRTEDQRRGCTESGAATSRSERWAHPSRSSSPPASSPSLSACHPSPASGRPPATATARLSHTISKFNYQAVTGNKHLSFQRHEGDFGKNLKPPKPYMHSMILMISFTQCSELDLKKKNKNKTFLLPATLVDRVSVMIKCVMVLLLFHSLLFYTS